MGKNVSKTIFLDTLFVVALINQRDQYHRRAKKLAAKYDGQRFLTTDAVLLEIGNALAKNFKDQAIEVIEDLQTSEDTKVVRLSPALFKMAFNLYPSHSDKQWGLVDCVSFVVMEQAGVRQALTFDQHYVQAGFDALLRRE